MVTEAEALKLLRRYGWTPFVRQKPSGGYIIAHKWINGRHVSKYVAAVRRLHLLTAQDVTGKLPDMVA